jgi:hypothetical protein
MRWRCAVTAFFTNPDRIAAMRCDDARPMRQRKKRKQNNNLLDKNRDAIAI